MGKTWVFGATLDGKRGVDLTRGDEKQRHEGMGVLRHMWHSGPFMCGSDSDYGLLLSVILQL